MMFIHKHQQMKLGMPLYALVCPVCYKILQAKPKIFTGITYSEICSLKHEERGGSGHMTGLHKFITWRDFYIFTYILLGRENQP